MDVEGFAAGEQGFDERDEDGDHGNDKRGKTGGDFGLAPDEQEVVDGHKEDADEGETPGGAGGDAQAVPACEADAADDDGGEQ